MQVLTTAPSSPHRCVLANYDEDNDACKAFEYLKDSNALNSVDSNEEWVRDCMHAQVPFIPKIARMLMALPTGMQVPIAC